jgi:hypothetical protein
MIMALVWSNGMTLDFESISGGSIPPMSCTCIHPFKGFFDVHILKGPPGLFSNPEVKLERVYGVVTWETSGEMCMTSNYSPSGDSNKNLPQLL